MTANEIHFVNQHQLIIYTLTQLSRLRRPHLEKYLSQLHRLLGVLIMFWNIHIGVLA